MAEKSPGSVMSREEELRLLVGQLVRQSPYVGGLVRQSPYVGGLVRQSPHDGGGRPTCRVCASYTLCM